MATSNDEQCADEQKVEVLCRFRTSELEAMRRDTGAEGAGTAVAAFARKRLAAMDDGGAR